MAISNWLVPGRANFEPYGIAPVGLSFRSHQLEAEFRAFTSQMTIAHVRFALVVAMIMVASYGGLDPFFFKKSLPLALAVRFLVLFPPPLLIFLFTFHERYRTYAQFAGILGGCIVGAGFCAMLTIEPNAQTLMYVT
jgi:hypothetical protein